jgi:glycosyltransferase involved in cell wall biosynthesis
MRRRFPHDRRLAEHGDPIHTRAATNRVTRQDREIDFNSDCFENESVSTDRPRLLMIVTGHGIFEHRDAALLRDAFQIETLSVKSQRPRDLAKLFLELWRARRRFDQVYVFFADLHFATAAVFCRLFRKRIAVAVGGYDANYVEGIAYGIPPSSCRGILTGYALGWAGAILPVHESLIEFQTDYAFPRRTGLMERNPGLDRRKLHVVANGYDAAFWSSQPEIVRSPRRVVCLGTPWETSAGADDPAAKQKIRLKGLDLILNAAPLLPEVEFLMLGVSSEAALLKTAGAAVLPPNVRIEGRLSEADLRGRFSSAHAFLMPSLSEGHPNALCEAMLCGCVPVGSPVNAIPEIIGDTGVLLREHTPENLAAAISKALGMKGEGARARICDRYSLERRRSALIRALASG